MGFMCKSVARRMTFLNHLGTEDVSIVDVDDFNREEVIDDKKWDSSKKELIVEESTHLLQDMPRKHYSSKKERLLERMADEYMALRMLGDRADATGGMKDEDFVEMLSKLTTARSESEYDQIVRKYTEANLEASPSLDGYISSIKEYAEYEKRKAAHTA